MTSPRHLWSGDWEREAAQTAEASSPPPATDVSTAGRPPARARRPRIRGLGLVDVRRLRLGLAAVVVIGAVAVAAVVVLGGSGAASAKPAWLGVETVSTPILGGGLLSGGAPLNGSGGFPFSTGALVVAVDPGSPAATAGIEPGDIITEIGGHTVAGPAQVNAAIAHYHAGQHTLVQVTQGLLNSVTVQIRLTAAPTG